MQSRTASQQEMAVVTEHAQQFAESIMNCRSSSAVQDGGQSTLLTSRVDALEDSVQDLDRQMGSMNNKMDTFETTMAAIHDQLKAMKESNDKITTQMTNLELSINSRFTEMESSLESSMDSRFTKMNTQITKMNKHMKKMDLSMTSPFQDMNSRVDGLRSDMNSRFEEMTQKNDKTSIKMEALFGQMWRWQSVCMSWDLAVPKQKEDSFRQVKKAYTVRTSTLTSPWVSIGTGTPTKDPVYNVPPKYTL
ncbi:hypothetical protein E4U12_000262 [Claviceps purpurea]|nr:hypothetical protein E4U12_000262 [Claviceps purpurea]